MRPHLYVVDNTKTPSVDLFERSIALGIGLITLCWMTFVIGLSLIGSTWNMY